MRTESSHARAWRVLALAALMALLLARVPYAASHHDLARDMFVAWRLLRGEAWPLEGPVLAGIIHLGPVWYYLLALLQLIGRNWYGTIALLGLLAALQIPVAYLLGKELHSLRAGLLWAAGLVVPSWSTYEWMLPLHTILSTLFVLAFALCCARYWRCGKRRYFYGMAVLFTLAFHAHPSNVGIALAGLFVVARAKHPRVTWRDYALAGFIVVAPLLPFLYVDALRGFEDLRRSGAWVAKGDATGSLWNVPGLFFAIVYGGTRYLFDPLTGMGARSAQVASCIVALGGVAGAAGLGFALRGHRRAVVAFAIACTLAELLVVALMREQTPYYMTTATRVMIAGLVAIGLASLGEGAAARALRVAVAASALIACVTATYGFARFQIRGTWPFAWWPMFDVRHAPDEIVPLLLTPTYAMDDSGRFLCAQDRPSIHGAWGSQLMHNYAMDMRLACGRTDVHIAGGEAGRTHWLGLSRDMYAKIGVRPGRRIGPIGLVPVRPVIADNPPLLLPALPVYPAYRPEIKDATTHHFSVPLAAGEHLAICDVAFGFNYAPTVSVRFAGNPVEPIAQDRVAAIYAPPGAAATAEIDVTTGDLFDVDIVVF